MGKKIVDKSRIVRCGILFFWFVILVFLFQKNFFSPPHVNLGVSIGEETIQEHAEWHGIYLKGEKVGYSKTEIKQGRAGYRIFGYSLMFLNTLGSNQRIESKIKSIVNHDYALKSFDFSLLSGTITFFLHGEVVGNALNLKMVSGKNTTRFTLPLKNIPFLSNTVRPFILKEGLSEGKKFCLPLFDPSTLSLHDITIQILGKETIIFWGKKIIVFKIKEFFEGIETIAFITKEGDTLKEEGPMGLTLINETQEQALSGDWRKKGETDFTAANAFPANLRINNCRKVKFLKVKISNLSFNDFNLNGGRQKLQGDRLEIRQETPESWKTFTLPYQKKDLKPFLQPTPSIQSNDERIILQARKIADNNRDAEITARTLTQWVFKNVKKKITLSIPNALDVLDLKAGDCNEHTALFTALSRSLGIPTRICAGIVYLNDKFYYHVWPEIYLGGWVAIDPTFNQFPADATHIRLVMGDLGDQIKIMGVVQKIKLEVLDYS